MKVSIYLILCLVGLNTHFAFAQEGEVEDHSGKAKHTVDHTDPEHEEFKHHYIGFHIGHSHISSGVQNGDTKWLALPSFGLAYVYGFNKKWGIGIHSEMIVEDFVVQGSGSDSKMVRSNSGSEVAVIERGRPIAIALIGIYKIHKHIGLLAGGGMEFSEHEDFGLVKIGAEFPYHFAPGWEMFGTFSVDLKIDAYNSFSFGFGIAKLF